MSIKADTRLLVQSKNGGKVRSMWCPYVKPDDHVKSFTAEDLRLAKSRCLCSHCWAEMPKYRLNWQAVWE